MVVLAVLAVTLALAFAFGRLLPWVTRGLPRPAGAALDLLATFLSGYGVAWATWPSYGAVVFMLLWWAGSLAGNVAGWLCRTAGRHA
ncbi:hypothetical protein AB0F13_25870 [Streptomyces sp. NPDC026206]|uniref:hypothetical protein n=1 Tax=Streptomyces sp. NPDC026206 TaxID=3157089 RepID=UPI0033C753EA